MLEFKDVCFKRDNETILSDITFKLESGRCLSAAGKNGAGKSTLCRLAGGLLLPTSGKVISNGIDTQDKKGAKLSDTISYVFQEPDRQLCRETPLQEIMFALKVKNIGKAEERARQMCLRFDIPQDASLFAMSRGMRQLTAIASAAAAEPKLLILDEPTSALDTRMRKILTEVIKEEKERGAAILLITHDPEFAFSNADDILVLKNGSIAVNKNTESLLMDKASAETGHFKLPVVFELALRLGIKAEKTTTAEDLAYILSVRKMRTAS